jgi:hypothetical protein
MRTVCQLKAVDIIPKEEGHVCPINTLPNKTATKKRLTLHLRDDHDGIATHGRSREFRMHMRNPAQTGSGCIRFND